MDTPAIVSDRNILLGKPVIAGSRISVEYVLESLAAGESVEELLSQHPRLTREGIQAALRYAVQVLRGDRVYSLHEPVA